MENKIGWIPQIPSMELNTLQDLKDFAIKFPYEHVYHTIAVDLIKGKDWRNVWNRLTEPITSKGRSLIEVIRGGIIKDSQNHYYLGSSSPLGMSEDLITVYIPTSKSHWELFIKGEYSKTPWFGMEVGDKLERFGIYCYLEKSDETLAEARYRSLIDKSPIIVTVQVPEKFIFSNPIENYFVIPTVCHNQVTVLDIEELDFEEIKSIQSIGCTQSHWDGVNHREKFMIQIIDECS